MAKHNRRYKDSVFVDLFSEDASAKDNFLSLYNALHGTHLDASAELKPLRLDRVMYMSFRNDVSCLIDNKIIVLAEHQSTVNANMPLRFLEYVARLYEQIQSPRDRYLRALKMIPTPEFYLFYNGREPYPPSDTLKLSDAFLTRPATPSLDLYVRVININCGRADKVVAACPPLAEYGIFVDTVRKHIALNPENGFRNAIKECIQNDILRDYLQRKSREVMNMLIAEYDYDVDIEVQREEASKIAFAQGIEQGIESGIAQGIERGIADGLHRKAIEDARNLKKLGVATDIIARATGLSTEDIAAL